MKKNYLIFVVDFDDTVFRKGKNGHIGKANESLIKDLIDFRNKGHKVILNTTRWGERLKKAVIACANKGLVFDAVNDNLADVTAYLGHNPRKIWGDVYIDNKAVYIECPK